MASQFDRAVRRLRPFASLIESVESAEPAGPRHPAVALAIAVPCAVLLLVLFGGWDQLATQTKAVADLIGR